MDVFQGVAHKSDFHRSLNIAIAKSTLAPKREGGRRGNLEARRLAITVGNFYFNLSGRPPTVTRYNLMVDDPISEIERHTKSGGEFFNLLAMIFRKSWELKTIPGLLLSSSAIIGPRSIRCLVQRGESQALFDQR